MYNKRFQLLIFLALFSFLLKNIYSQPLKNNSIELKLSYSPGITNGTQIYAGIPGIKGIFTVKNNFGGFGGKISFNHYISKNVSLSITSGIISANSIVTIFKTQTISIIPLLMGAKYFPNLLSYNTAIRPYLQGSLGMMFGYQSGIESLNVGVQTQTAFGSYLGFGSDLIFGSLVKLTSDIGYNFMSDFQEPIGGRKNYNGVVFSIGFGFMF